MSEQRALQEGQDSTEVICVLQTPLGNGLFWEV